MMETTSKRFAVTPSLFIKVNKIVKTRGYHATQNDILNDMCDLYIKIHHLEELANEKP
jgi:hypothetical protein